MSNLWKRVPPENYNRETFEGAGSFTDKNGNYSIAGNTLVHRWGYSQAKMLVTFFSASWCGFSAFMIGLTWNGYGSLTVNGRPYKSLQDALEADPTAYAIITVVPLIGLFMAYGALSMWINRTTVTHSDQGLEVTRGPLPWKDGKVNILSENISECYVQYNDRPFGPFRVVAIQINGPEVIIMSRLNNYRDARILEQWLESKLGIEDKKVHNEEAS